MKFVKLLPALIALLGIIVASRIIGALFKILHWVQVDTLLFYNTILLIVLLVAISFLSSYSKAKLLLSKPYAAMPHMLKRIFKVAIAITIVGALFKIMHWKGADIELIIGLTSLAIVMLLWALWIAIRVKKIDG
jgi:hypothetical protein